ncbi:hypothetical protein LXL04_029172 [Taraxacum kok-saghyz]
MPNNHSYKNGGVKTKSISSASSSYSSGNKSKPSATSGGRRNSTRSTGNSAGTLHKDTPGGLSLTFVLDTFEFDEVLTEFASQKRVYEVVAKPVVERVGQEREKEAAKKIESTLDHLNRRKCSRQSCLVLYRTPKTNLKGFILEERKAERISFSKKGNLKRFLLCKVSFLEETKFEGISLV